MGYDPIYFVFFVLVSLLIQVMMTVQKGLRHHTRSQYIRQFKLFLAFITTQAFEVFDASATLMCFLQFLALNSLSFRVINNYMSAPKFYFARCQSDVSVFENSMVKRMLRGIQYSCVATPTPKGLFLLHQIRMISQYYLSESFESTLLEKSL